MGRTDRPDWLTIHTSTNEKKQVRAAGPRLPQLPPGRAGRPGPAPALAAPPLPVLGGGAWERRRREVSQSVCQLTRFYLCVCIAAAPAPPVPGGKEMAGDKGASGQSSQPVPFWGNRTISDTYTCLLSTNHRIALAVAWVVLAFGGLGPFLLLCWRLGGA